MQWLKSCSGTKASKPLLQIGLGPAYFMKSCGSSMLNLGNDS